MDNPLGNIAVLNCIEFNDYHYWMLCDERLKNVFQYLSENIDESNIVTEMMNLTYDELKKDNEILSDSELESGVFKLDQMYPKIRENSRNTVTKLDSNLRKQITIEKEWDQLLADLRDRERKFGPDISKLKTDFFKLEFFEKDSYSVCADKSQLLISKLSTTKKLKGDLKNDYCNEQKTSIFLHEMIFDKYLHRITQFDNYFEIFLYENFNVLINDTKPLEEDIPSQLLNIKSKLIHIQNFITDTKTNFLALEECLTKLRNSKLTNNNQKMLYQELENLDQVNTSRRIQLSMYTENLELLIRQRIDQEIEIIMYESNKLKHTEAKHNLGELQKVHRVIGGVTHNIEILWIVLQIDSKQILSINDNLFISKKDSLLCAKRKVLMQKIQGNNAVNIYRDKYLQDIAHILKTPANSDSLLVLREFKLMQKQRKNIKSNAVKRNYYKHSQRIYSKLNCNEQILKAYVCNGPTNGPNLINTNLSQKINLAKLSLNQNTKLYSKLRDKYKSQIIDMIATNKYYQYYRLLWIWFLTEPRNIVDAIKSIKHAASKTASYKCISGLSRRNVDK